MIGLLVYYVGRSYMSVMEPIQCQIEPLQLYSLVHEAKSCMLQL